MDCGGCVFSGWLIRSRSSVRVSLVGTACLVVSFTWVCRSHPVALTHGSCEALVVVADCLRPGGGLRPSTRGSRVSVSLRRAVARPTSGDLRGSCLLLLLSAWCPLVGAPLSCFVLVLRGGEGAADGRVGGRRCVCV